jgi:hypothetical protein
MDGLFPSAAPTLAEQIGELKRELGQRAAVYPKWVRNGRITQAKADAQVARMTAALATLERLYAEGQR